MHRVLLREKMHALTENLREVAVLGDIKGLSQPMRFNTAGPEGWGSQVAKMLVDSEKVPKKSTNLMKNDG